MNLFMDSFSKDALEAHNKFRAMHQAPSIKWSRSLAKDAEVWAQQLARENCLRNGDTDDGENLYAISGKPDLKGNEAVEKWYDGVGNYKFHRPGFQSDAGHFSQIVWKSTKEIGIGKAKTSDGKVFVVARYRPAGNVVNRFEQNVFAKKSESPSTSSSSRVYTSRIEERNSEPVRTERSYERKTDRFDRSKDRDDDFFKGFEDMRIGRRGDKGGTRTETVLEQVVLFVRKYEPFKPLMMISEEEDQEDDGRTMTMTFSRKTTTQTRQDGTTRKIIVHHVHKTADQLQVHPSPAQRLTNPSRTSVFLHTTNTAPCTLPRPLNGATTSPNRPNGMLKSSHVPALCNILARASVEIWARIWPCLQVITMALDKGLLTCGMKKSRIIIFPGKVTKGVQATLLS